MFQDPKRRFQVLVAEVSSAYFSTNQARVADIPDVIRNVAEALRTAGGHDEAAAAVGEPAERPRPSRAQIRASIRPDALISFEDHKPYKTLGRHLAARGLTADSYRAKWGLPDDYPMVAPSYSAARSRLAKQMGLAELGVEARKARR